MQRVKLTPLMTNLTPEPPNKLAILRQHDHFRDWQSLDDKRVCVSCDAEFTGHEVVICDGPEGYELRCPTQGCQSRVHQWVYPGNPLIDDNANADWWQALGEARKAQVA